MHIDEVDEAATALGALRNLREAQSIAEQNLASVDMAVAAQIAKVRGLGIPVDGAEPKPLRAEPDIAVVVRGPIEAAILQRNIAVPGLRFITMRQVLMGVRFAHIIITDIGERSEADQCWIDTALRTRLMPNGCLCGG